MEQPWEQRRPLLSLTVIYMARIEKANSPRSLKANTPKISIHQPSATNFKAIENYTLKSNKNSNDNKKVKSNRDRPRRATYLRKHCGKFCFLLYRVTNQNASLPLISPTDFLYTETMSLFRKESNEMYRLKCLHCKITTIFQKRKWNMRSSMHPLSLFDHSESTADRRKQSTYLHDSSRREETCPRGLYSRTGS